MTTRKCIRDRNGKPFNEWRDTTFKDKNNVYIGRGMYRKNCSLPPSDWRNPYSVKKYGRDKCLRMYKNYLFFKGLINRIEELRGKTLYCWCKENEDCHGDILIEILNRIHLSNMV